MDMKTCFSFAFARNKCLNIAYPSIIFVLPRNKSANTLIGLFFMEPPGGHGGFLFLLRFLAIQYLLVSSCGITEYCYKKRFL